MITHRRKFSTILVGGGPASLAVLLSAHRDGRLRTLLQQGLAIVERSPRLGAGQIGRYAINSDSTGDTFLDSLRKATEPKLHRILHTAVAKRCAAAGQGPVPLTDVGELMAHIGEAMRTIMEEYPQCQVLTSCCAESAQQIEVDRWSLNVRDSIGKLHRLETQHLVVATGAGQPDARLQGERVAGMPVLERWRDRLMQSGEVLTAGGLLNVAERLKGKSSPKVAILGGSTSALAVAYSLLHRMPHVPLKPGSVTLFHRRSLKVYYTSQTEAIADGYCDFGPEDLCPITQRVYRFAGLRLDSRELLMQLYGLGGRQPEPRMNLHLLQGDNPEAIRRIDSADLVIAAFGYRPNALPLMDGNGVRISLLADTSSSSPLVDSACRVLDAAGKPVTGVFGIGLSAGFRHPDAFGGEPSFTGQVNGLWLWQNGVGSIIASAILARVAKGPQLVPTMPTSDFGGRDYVNCGVAS